MVTDTSRCRYPRLDTTRPKCHVIATCCIGPPVPHTLRPVALQHAILVALCEQAGSGYELARRFDRSIGHFWAATHQQIYRTLRGGMEGDGWLSVQIVEQHGRPDKKVYSVSADGHAELRRWIAAPLSGRGGTVADHRTRDLAIKIRAAAFGGCRGHPGSGRRVTYRARRTAGHLPRIPETSVPPTPAALTGTALHQYLVLRGGMRAEEGAIEWLTEVLEVLGGAL